MLVGHMKLDEGGGPQKEETEAGEPDNGTEGEIPCKWRATQSIASLKDAKRRENIMKQEQRWMELMAGCKSSTASLGAPTEVTTTSTVMSTVSSVGAKGTATAMVNSTTEGDTVDLEEAMMSQGDDDDDGYSKKYQTTSEDKTDRSVARAKQKEAREKQEQERAVMRYAEQQVQKEVDEKQQQMLEQVLLEEEEKAVEERRQKNEERQNARLERKATELVKQRERKKERREKHKRKRKERMEEQEEKEMIDNTDKDKDYDPDKDPEAEFVVEDQEMDDKDTFEVEKHVHTVNFDEAGDYLVAMNRYMEAFAKNCMEGKDDMAREYKKLIKFVKLMIEELGAYSPIEAVDMDAVFDTIVDPQCIAWRRVLHGMKTGNSKEILRVEEQRWKVERSIEECEISPEEEVKTFTDMMQVKSKTDRVEVVRMVKWYFGHVAKVHEEAASAARIAQSLINEIDENSWLQIVSNGTRPLVMLQVPKMLQQAATMKSEHEHQQKAEQMQGLPIEDIIKEQNMPRPVECWVESKIMSLSPYLAVAVYYFLFNTIDQKKMIANQTVLDKFKVSRSNMHTITSGQKYAGGSIMTGRKLKSVQELEEHGESMVKIVKVKPKPKAKKSITVTKSTPKIIPLLFLPDDTVGEVLRRSRRKKNGDKKDNDKLMVH